MKQSDSTHAVGEVEIRGILRRLPPCNRCRARRRKCDISIPSCSNCRKSGSECQYHDHVLDEDVPRAYLASLMEKIRGMSTGKADENVEMAGTDLYGDVVRSKNLDAILEDPRPVGSDGSCTLLMSPMLPFNKPFWGPTSVYHDLELSLASIPTLLLLPEISEACVVSGQAVFDLLVPFVNTSVSLPSSDVRKYLLDIYNISVETFYPILRAEYLSDLAASYDMTAHKPPEDAIKFTQMYLVLAISTRLLSVKDSRLEAPSTAYFIASKAEMDKQIKRQPSNESVQLLLLICVYLLLDETAGDIWELTGLASRMSVDLSVHQDPDHSYLYRTLSIFERNIAVAYGRPVEPPDFSSECVPTPSNSMCDLLFNLSCIKYQIYSASLSREMEKHTPSIIEQLQAWRASFESIPALSVDVSLHVELQYDETILLFASSFGLRDQPWRISEVASRYIQITANFLNHPEDVPTIDVPAHPVLLLSWITRHNIFRAGLLLIASRDNGEEKNSWEPGLLAAVALLLDLESHGDLTFHNHLKALHQYQSNFGDS